MKNFTPRQIEIIKYSFEIISQEGIAGLSMKNIAKKIGIKESSLYNHFDGKKTILKGIFNYSENKIHSLIKDIDRASCSDINKLKLLYFSLCSNAEDDLDLALLLIREFHHYDPYYKEDYLSLFTFLRSKIIQVIQNAIAHGEIKDYLDADFIVYVIKGCVREIIINNHSIPNYNLKENAERLWRNIEAVILI